MTVPHTHPADDAAVGAEKVKATMRQQIGTVRARPGAVLAAAVHQSTNDVRVALGRPDTNKRSVRRY